MQERAFCAQGVTPGAKDILGFEIQDLGSFLGRKFWLVSFDQGRFGYSVKK